MGIGAAVGGFRNASTTYLIEETVREDLLGDYYFSKKRSDISDYLRKFSDNDNR